jgi:hypothetical protein
VRLTPARRTPVSARPATVGSLRFRAGTARLRIARELRHPVRLRRPLFTPARELRHALAEYSALRDGRQVAFDGWASHQPVLIELLSRISTPRCLELGIGFGSTPIVVGLSGSSVSLETSESWYRRFARFDEERHRILLTHAYDAQSWNVPYFSESWDVALIDNSPGRTRQGNLLKLRDRARFIVCHDTQECFKPSASAYGWDFSAFDHVWTYDRFPTFTTVVSATEPIPLDDLGGRAGIPSR